MKGLAGRARWILRAPCCAAAAIAAAGVGAAPAHAAATAPPGWNAPAEYRLDLEVDSNGEHLVMHRFVSNGRMRTEMTTGDGGSFVMLEMGDADGTSWMLVPGEKTGIKQSAKGMAAAAATAAKRSAAASETGDADPQGVAPAVERVGRETVDGIECDEYAFTVDGETATSWNDAATGRPVKMESAQGTIAWKNYAAGPQEAGLFAPPEDYAIHDMDAMMKQASDAGMGGMLQGVMGGAGLGFPGAGGVGGMAQGMAGRMGGGIGAGLGATLGGALGGPLGAMAGEYLGGEIGGMIGRKTAGAVTGAAGGD